jgi:hypothetical protein
VRRDGDVPSSFEVDARESAGEQHREVADGTDDVLAVEAEDLLLDVCEVEASPPTVVTDSQSFGRTRRTTRPRGKRSVRFRRRNR